MELYSSLCVREPHKSPRALTSRNRLLPSYIWSLAQDGDPVASLGNLVKHHPGDCIYSRCDILSASCVPVLCQPVPMGTAQSPHPSSLPRSSRWQMLTVGSPYGA